MNVKFNHPTKDFNRAYLEDHILGIPCVGDFIKFEQDIEEKVYEVKKITWHVQNNSTYDAYVEVEIIDAE